jgi:hypothetical protein
MGGSYLVQASRPRPTKEHRMTREATHVHDMTTRQHGTFAVLEIAAGLADGLHTLIPSATAAVVVSIGSDWQLLASRGPVDITATWRAAIADQVRDSDLPQQHAGYLVAPFSSVGMHALVVVATEPGDHLPRRAHALVRPLLDAGGILLDRALAVQQRERAVRRVVGLCQKRDVRPVHTLADLEDAIASLFVDGSARFHHPGDLAGTGWSARRLVRIACEIDQPSIGRSPAYEGLMPRDLTYQIAIPLPFQEGAILVEAPAGGEALDTRNLAAAIALTRDHWGEIADDRALVHHA